MIQIVLKSYNIDLIVKKDFVTTFLVIEREENLDDLTLEQLIHCGYKQDFLPN